VIGPWIAETQAKKVTAQAEIRTATGRRRQMSRDDIAAIVAALADLAQVVCEADPADKADPVGPVFAACDPGVELAGLPELAVAELGERHARASPDSALTGPLDASPDQSESIPRPESFVANVYVSALTYCTTMTTCPSGLFVTVYQMVKPSEGR
jgi:hypothetical protein